MEKLLQAAAGQCRPGTEGGSRGKAAFGTTKEYFAFIDSFDNEGGKNPVFGE